MDAQPRLPAFYKTLPRDEAYARVHRLLASTNATFVGDNFSIERKISGDSNRPRLNVVILLEESLGSEFWGCLGRTNTLTPEMDRLATQEGLLFDNIYASGNRTVRGMEGALSSFPPLPGDAIVHRDRSENVETIARVLKRDGYNTMFLYGGHAMFDNMKPFLVANGFDQIVDEKDFPNPSFVNVWGVSGRGFIRGRHPAIPRLEPDQQTVLRHHPVRVESQALHLSQGPHSRKPEWHARQRGEIHRLVSRPVFQGRETGGILDEHHFCRRGRPWRAGLWQPGHPDFFLRNPARDPRPGGRAPTATPPRDSAVRWTCRRRFSA